MCCIIHRPKGAPQIKEEYIKKIIKKNPHGWGVAYIHKNNSIIYKSMDMEKSIDKIRELEENNIEFLFHARWATHGDKNVQNCHPYRVKKQGALFHNGKINIDIQNKSMSDTWHFAKMLMQVLNDKRNSMTYENIIEEKKNIIGESRLAFLKNNGDIIKTGKWEELDGCSYSKLNWNVNSNYSQYHYGHNYGHNYGYNYNNRYDYSYNRVGRSLSKHEIEWQIKNETLKDVHSLREFNEYELEGIIRKYPIQMANIIFYFTGAFPLM